MLSMILRVSALSLLVALVVTPQQKSTGSQEKGKAAPAKASDIPEDNDIIRVDVDLVSILASVRGKGNVLLPNLQQSDFHLFEDGKEQQIKYFTRETDLPLTIGLLVDVSGSQVNLLDTTRRAASEFLTNVIRDKDLAFIISFGKDSELLQDSTSSLRLLKRGLQDVKPNVAVGGIQPGPVPTIGSPAGTVMYDAIYLAANERLKKEAGRKMMVLITDGDDNGSKVSRAAAIEAAHKSDTVIYSIFYADYRFGSDLGALKKLSDETGGHVFEVGRGNSLESIFKQIQEEMRTQYNISFSTTNPKKDGSYRKIDFKMSNKDYKVQARKGYYAINPE